MAAVSKIIDLQAFTNRLIVHSGLSERPAQVVAAVLPWLELTCGLSLALGVAVREAAAVVCCLLAVFVVYSGLHLGETDCGCFLFSDRAPVELFGWWPILRNTLLFICGVIVASK